MRNSVIRGDCLPILRALDASSVDLIVTSPPYPGKRSQTYDSVPAAEYADWFLPVAQQLLRVLRDEGSFILNIKEPAVSGERHTCVLQLILGLRQQGWLWTEEYIWHKRNCYPGKWPNRFRDAWERCLHFTKQRKFKMFQDAVMVPTGKWAEKRLAKLSKTDRRRDESKVRSGFGKNISNWVGRNQAYPTNVLHLATECSNRSHSATFPMQLPEWFIRLFTEENDLVLDPFLGSGTTALACINLGRSYIGIEKNRDYFAVADAAIKEALTGRAGRLPFKGYI